MEHGAEGWGESRRIVPGTEVVSEGTVEVLLERKEGWGKMDW